MPRINTSMSRRSFARSTAAVSAGLAMGIPASRAVVAQDATPAASPVAPGLPPLPEGAVVVAEGLWNPRFLAIGDSGTLYITENGIGGDEIIAPPGFGTGELEGTPGATPVAEAAPEQPPTTRGYSGQISQVTSDGTQSVVVAGLASYSTGVGPVGIQLGPGEIYFDIGGAAVEMGIAPLPEENTVNRYVLETGAVEQLANIGQYEVDNNPDGTDVNPNLYQLAQRGDGTLLVADAGGNTIYSVDPAAGTFELVTVVPSLGQLPGTENVPAEQAGRQPVPTAVTVAPDDSTFVGMLSEFWPEGAPSVDSLLPDATFAPVAGPLLFNVALTVGPDGNLYGSQLFGMVEGSDEPGPGSVVRIYGDGTVETVVEGVMMPHGITFDVAGNIYIAINSLMSAPGAPAGQVIRIDGVAAV